MWDYRLLKDEHGIRVVKAYYEDDQAVGYAEADLATVEEIHDGSAAQLTALDKPILIEVDGKLVEETNETD